MVHVLICLAVCSALRHPQAVWRNPGHHLLRRRPVCRAFSRSATAVHRSRPAPIRARSHRPIRRPAPPGIAAEASPAELAFRPPVQAARAAMAARGGSHSRGRWEVRALFAGAANRSPWPLRQGKGRAGVAASVSLHPGAERWVAVTPCETAAARPSSPRQYLAASRRTQPAASMRAMAEIAARRGVPGGQPGSCLGDELGDLACGGSACAAPRQEAQRLPGRAAVHQPCRLGAGQGVAGLSGPAKAARCTARWRRRPPPRWVVGASIHVEPRQRSRPSSGRRTATRLPGG
jgi:hypothetical protein